MSDPVSGSVIPGGAVVGIREDTGRRVVALCGSGGYAEWVAVAESGIWPVPDHISDADALTQTASGLTAWPLLEAAPVAPDESAVVTGAAGALGSIAVQLAVRRGGGSGDRVGLDTAEAGVRGRSGGACRDRQLRGETSAPSGDRLRRGRRRGSSVGINGVVRQPALSCSCGTTSPTSRTEQAVAAPHRVRQSVDEARHPIGSPGE
jgi:hypothetical protein